MTIRTILCAVDMSPHSTALVRAALTLARQEQARLVVFHALEPALTRACATAWSTDVLTKMVSEDLDALIKRVAPRGRAAASHVTTAVGLGEAHTAVLAAVEAQHADLIVMGTQGFTGLRKLFFGSTAARILAESPVPVLALPPQAVPVGALPEGRLLGLHRLLVAVDFSEASMLAIEAAADLARRWKLSLVLVHAEPPTPAIERWTELLDEHHERRVHRARRELELIAREIEGVGVTASTVAGRPEEVIAQTVEDEPGTLVVLGLSTDPRRPRFTPGSTAYKMLCLSHAPVLSIPAPDRSAQNSPSPDGRTHEKRPHRSKVMA